MIVSVLSILIVLGAPLLQQAGVSFQFVESLLTRLLLIVFVVYGVRQSAMDGLLAFLAAFTILLERNHEVLTKLPNQQPRALGQSFGLPIQAPPLVGVEESVAYAPKDSAETKISPESENAVGLTDNIPRIPPAPLASTAPAFYTNKGLL